MSDHRNSRPTTYSSTSSGSRVADRFGHVSTIASKFSNVNAVTDLNLEYKKVATSFKCNIIMLLVVVCLSKALFFFQLYEKELVENERLRKVITDLEKSLEHAKLGAEQVTIPFIYYSFFVYKVLVKSP